LSNFTDAKGIVSSIQEFFKLKTLLFLLFWEFLLIFFFQLLFLLLLLLNVFFNPIQLSKKFVKLSPGGFVCIGAKVDPSVFKDV
jgi:hypothetical protein